MLKLFVLEDERITGMTEGEHNAPILTPAARKPLDLSEFKTVLYFYRGAEGQPAGPGLFLKLPQPLWPDQKTPLFVMLDPVVDY